jgi:hypothetical protein
LAWYAPDDIPITLLTDLGDEPALRRAIGRLTAYSMITHEQGVISVHRLVQAVTRTPDRDSDDPDPHRTPDQIGQALDDATHSLAQHLRMLGPRTPDDWPAFQALLPHIQTLAGHTEPFRVTVRGCG